MLCTAEVQLFSLNFPRCVCSYLRRTCKAVTIMILLRAT